MIALTLEDIYSDPSNYENKIINVGGIITINGKYEAYIVDPNWLHGSIKVILTEKHIKKLRLPLQLGSENLLYYSTVEITAKMDYERDKLPPFVMRELNSIVELDKQGKKIKDSISKFGSEDLIDDQV